jgi:hypothetical protein
MGSPVCLPFGIQFSRAVVHGSKSTPWAEIEQRCLTRYSVGESYPISRAIR